MIILYDGSKMTVVQQNLLRSLILQKYPAGSEAGAGSEAMPDVLYVTGAYAPVGTDVNGDIF